MAFSADFKAERPKVKTDQKVQINEYETVPYFLQLSQNLTSDCLLISVHLPVVISYFMM